MKKQINVVDASVGSMTPWELLVMGIFGQAKQDCQLKNYQEDVLRFAHSEWCQMLLRGAVAPERVESLFREYINKNEKKKVLRNCVEINRYCLLKYRDISGLTQSELAKRVGVGTPSIAAYEAGNTCPRKPTFERLCEVLGCSQEDRKTRNKEVAYDSEPTE